MRLVMSTRVPSRGASGSEPGPEKGINYYHTDADLQYSTVEKQIRRRITELNRRYS